MTRANQQPLGLRRSGYRLRMRRVAPTGVVRTAPLAMRFVVSVTGAVEVIWQASGIRGFVTERAVIAFLPRAMPGIVPLRRV